MSKRVTAILPILLAVGCGGDDASPIESQDARADVKNACGGRSSLAFLGRPAAPADRCGACGSGTLVCAAPEMLVCIGSTDASCADGGAVNLCGGRGPLTLDGMPATPGKPCGPCGDGMTFCAAPEIVACLGAGRASACDAGGEIAVVDAAISDSSRDTPAIDVATADTSVDSALSDAPNPDATIDQASSDATSADATPDTSLDVAPADAAKQDSPLDAASSDTSVVDVGPINACGGQGPLRYQGVDALPGGACGPCSQGTLVCASATTLTCTGAPTSDVCNDGPAPNACGGTGPLYFRGVPTAMGVGCGGCGGYTRCATPTHLYCWANLSCQYDGCDIPLSAYSASGPTLPALPAETAPTTTSASAITLAANWLVYNPFDFRLYASVGSLQGAGGNAVAVIDPYSSTIVNSIPVGSEPKKMALSDDGTTLWVALDGEGAVRKVDLLTGTPGLQFGLGKNDQGVLWYADNLAVLPRTKSSVVVTRYEKQFGGVDGALIYDDGIPRQRSEGMRLAGKFVIPSYAPELLFTFDPAGSRWTTNCVNATGIFMRQDVAPFPGINISLSFADNIVYSSSGVAYDIASGSVRGTFAGRGPVAPDPPKRRAYFVAVPSGAMAPTVSAYDMDTFLPRGSEILSVSMYDSVALSNFARWGRYGYAFRVNSHSIVIARSALVGATP